MCRWWRNLRDWGPRVIRDHAKNEGDWTLNGWQEAWVTVRALLALLLGRSRPLSWRTDYVEVASANHSPYTGIEYASGVDWDSFRAPRWLRDGLVYDVDREGYP